MSLLGLDPAVDGEGRICRGDWKRDAIRNLVWGSGGRTYKYRSLTHRASGAPGRMDLGAGRLEAGSYSSSPGERTWAELGQAWHAGRGSTGSQTSLGDEAHRIGPVLIRYEDVRG